jgi:hypothetical protein
MQAGQGLQLLRELHRLGIPKGGNDFQWLDSVLANEIQRKCIIVQGA